MKHTIHTVPVGCVTWWELKSKLHPSQFTNPDLWCYPALDGYRLCDGATNGWIGIIETMSGDEVVDLRSWASVDFAGAFKFAQEVVRKYNKERFNTTLEDYE